MTDFLTAALEYASLGYLVIPLRPGEKSPLTAHGLKDASSDESQIEAWWSVHPTANIGLLTTGLLVVDIDGADNPWLDTDRALALATAPFSRTPRGGRHYVFRQPEGGSYRNTTGRIANKVDTRADDGYIVAAPSVVDGKAYQWANELEPREQLPLPPDWLLNALVGSQAASTVEVGWEAGFIPDGKRHSTLVSLAGNMRRVGMSEDEIFAAIRQTNANRCKPPLDMAEVIGIAKRVARYEPNQIATAVAEHHYTDPTSVGPILLCMETIEPRNVDWLWFGRMAAARLTLLSGDPGLGKSFLTCDIASRVSTGRNWPDGSPCEQGQVLLITGEDDPHDTIRPRLDAHEADVSQIHLLRTVKRLGKTGQPEEVMFTLADIANLEAALKLLPNCRLIIIDPIGSFLGSGTDAHRDNEVRSILAPLAKLAEQYGCAILIVAHHKKGGGNRADDKTMGSVAFTGICRSSWHLFKDRSEEARRLLLGGKNNLAMPQPGLAFSIQGLTVGRVVWEDEPVDMSADDAVIEEHGLGEKGPRGPKPTLRGIAEQWLREVLADGPQLASDIETWRSEQNITAGTLAKAKASIGIESYRPDPPSGPWYWRFQDDTCKQDEPIGSIAP